MIFHVKVFGLDRVGCCVVKLIESLPLSVPVKRDGDWLANPMLNYSVLVFYWAMIKLVLPQYMSGRDPFLLKSFVKWYNIFQIIYNAVLLVTVSTMIFVGEGGGSVLMAASFPSTRRASI